MAGVGGAGGQCPEGRREIKEVLRLCSMEAFVAIVKALLFSGRKGNHCFILNRSVVGSALMF